MFTKEHLEALRSMNDIQNLHPSDFEYFSKYLLELRGFTSVYVTKKHGENGGDGGIDIKAVKDNTKVIIQCKKWNHGFFMELYL